MDSDTCNDKPLFCIETKDKTTDTETFVNFYGNDNIQAPTIELDEQQLAQELLHPSEALDALTIPMNLGGLFWKKSRENNYTAGSPNAYVIDCKINLKFALRKVISSEVVRYYVISVALSAIEKKFNDNRHGKGSSGQFVGHQLDFDVCNYNLLNGEEISPKSTELVNNKVIPLDLETSTSLSRGLENINSCDFYYRPLSKNLTCCIATDFLPTTISYNDDRIVVKVDGRILLDACLPFFIDLSRPIMFKFDDRLCLFRIVFKIVESESQ